MTDLATPYSSTRHFLLITESWAPDECIARTIQMFRECQFSRQNPETQKEEFVNLYGVNAVNIPGRHGWTIFGAAIITANLNFAKWILKQSGGDLDDNGMTLDVALSHHFKESKEKRTQVVLWLLKKGCKLTEHMLDKMDPEITKALLRSVLVMFDDLRTILAKK